MVNAKKTPAKKLVQIWLVGAFICWVAMGGSFGASVDLTPSPNPHTEAMAAFVYIPIISLLWPVWINIFLLGSPPPDKSAIKRKS